jgi:hypothetical protein
MRLFPTSVQGQEWAKCSALGVALGEKRWDAYSKDTSFGIC